MLIYLVTIMFKIMPEIIKAYLATDPALMIELLTGIIPSLLLKSLSGLVSASNLRISKLSF